MNIDYKNATIIDVRTPQEFSEDCLKNAINIPLEELITKVEEIKKMAKPIVLYCRSGNRSDKAVSFLQALNLEDVHNGGAWEELAKKI